MNDLNCSKGDIIKRKKADDLFYKHLTESLAPKSKIEEEISSLREQVIRKINRPNYWLWLLIATIVGLSLLKGCTAHAQELTASYYDVSALKRDGQWAITKGVMANGKLFRDDRLTCASWDYPLNSILRIRRLDNPKNSVVVVNSDRTARRFKGIRIDLSPVAFKAISPSGTTKEGLIKVTVTEIGG